MMQCKNKRASTKETHGETRKPWKASEAPVSGHYTMDPKVCGKLLMLHRKGNGVDVEAIYDRIPLQQDAGKGP